MNLRARLAQLEKHQPQLTKEQRQNMIASIQVWVNELELKAETDREARLYVEAIRNMLRVPRDLRLV
jgi:hypothetical protein